MVFPDDSAAIVVLTNQDAAPASGAIANQIATALFATDDKLAASRTAQARAIFDGLSADGYAAACAAVRDMDQRQSLSRIHAPTLVIAGSEDFATPPADGHYIAGNIPGAHYVELPAAHLSNVQAAPAFTQAVLQFLGSRTE